MSKPDRDNSRLYLRLSDEQLDQYRHAAERSGLLLHDWSRRILDRAAAEATEAQTAA